MHVDVVKNEWLAGLQYVAARVSLNQGHLTVDSGEPEVWEPIVLRPLRDEKGEEIFAEKEPENFLFALADHIRGTYLFATKPHPDEECRFVHLVDEIEPAQSSAPSTRRS